MRCQQIRRRVRWLRLLAPGALFAAAAAAAAGGGTPQLAVTMRQMLASLSKVLPAALSEKRFSDPANRAEIGPALAQLALGANHLASHGNRRDASFAFLARALASEARRIHSRFQAGRVDEARFLLLELTEGCVACHSRLPAKSSNLSDRLLANPALKDLPLEERAQLEFTTRQFDRALGSYETLLADPSLDPDDLDLSGRVDEYLELALHVARDPARARRTLEALSHREGVSEGLRGSLAAWTKALSELAAEPAAPPSLAQAEAWIQRAEAAGEPGWDRPGLVYYLAASGSLHRLLDTTRLSRIDEADAHYWLGLVDSRVGRAFWLSQTAALLERSIRLAPDGPHAGDALELLRQFEVATHTGTEGSDVPRESWDKLNELESLIQAAGHPPAPGK